MVLVLGLLAHIRPLVVNRDLRVVVVRFMVVSVLVDMDSAPVSIDVRELILRMSAANSRWCVPQIHGELGKLGVKVAEATVAKYMVQHRYPPSQTWRTVLTNHVKDLASAGKGPSRGHTQTRDPHHCTQTGVGGY